MSRKIQVVWYGGREKWDQDILDLLCPPASFNHLTVDQAPLDGGAIVTIPGTAYADDVPEINAFLGRYWWTVVILTSDEESRFPWWRLQHPNMRIWLSTPRPDVHKNSSLRFFPIGWPKQETEAWSQLAPASERVLSWFFHGQVTHLRREEMLEYMTKVDGGKGIPSPGFTQGMPRREYLTNMALAKVCPSPSGPASPDCFRTWEALEAGAVPIVDQGPKPDPEGRAVGGYPRDFWRLLLGTEEVPFPVVEEWDEGPTMAESILALYPTVNNSVFAWWQWYKRELHERLVTDVEELSGKVVKNQTIDSLITVLVPTSPVPANPSTSHIEETISSIRAQIPSAEVFILFDGVRSEQQDRLMDYEEYIRRVLWLSGHTWTNVYPIRHLTHQHQARMVRDALTKVTTPLVLFVEHDTPLTGSIPWDLCVNEIMIDKLDVIRFYHEKVMQPEHEHLMGEMDWPFLRTIQFSARPHLASADYYRRLLHSSFIEDERHMIEDRVHGRVQDEGWHHHRLAIFAPGGNIQRSTHLDARGDDPKWVEG